MKTATWPFGPTLAVILTLTARVAEREAWATNPNSAHLKAGELMDAIFQVNPQDSGADE